MAKACGIRLGRRRFEVVTVEGSAKKPRLTAAASGEIDASGPDWLAAAASALREATKGMKVDGDHVSLVVDSGISAYRTLKLPFAEKSKVEQVIKFEVESELPQFDVDEIVVDWHSIGGSEVETEFLVTATPKEQLGPYIAACERSGFEPFSAELECTALVNAALASGGLIEDEAQVLVHVGETTTSVAVIDGGQLRAIRAVRVGGLDPVQAPVAAETSEEADQPDEFLTESEQDEAAEEPAPAAAPPRDTAASVRRLVRELVRTIAAVELENPLSGIYVTGFELPGLVGETVEDLLVQRLEMLPESASAKLGEGDDPGQYTAAYGTALQMLGAGELTSQLRREELRYAGKFERLELPLAVFALLLMTLLGVFVIVTSQRITRMGEGKPAQEAGPAWLAWLPWVPKEDMPPQPGDLQVWLISSNNYMFDDLERKSQGRLRNPPKDIERYARDAEKGVLVDTRKFKQLETIRNKLRKEISFMMSEMGDMGEIKQPMSALEGMSQVLGVLDQLGDDVGRFSIRHIRANTIGGTRRADEKVQVVMDLTFFADEPLEATANYSNFKNAIESKPWFTLEAKPTITLETGDGISTEGVRIDVDLNKIPTS